MAKLLVFIVGLLLGCWLGSGIGAHGVQAQAVRAGHAHWRHDLITLKDTFEWGAAPVEPVDKFESVRID